MNRWTAELAKYVNEKCGEQRMSKYLAGNLFIIGELLAFLFTPLVLIMIFAIGTYVNSRMVMAAEASSVPLGIEQIASSEDKMVTQDEESDLTSDEPEFDDSKDQESMTDQ